MISLTFDDGLDQHLDHVLPRLAECGLHGTFYVHLAAVSLVRRSEAWRCAAVDGHELGNHTIFHPATEGKAWVREGNAIERYTLDRMRLELETANEWLAAWDGQRQRTFAYPCSNPTLGRHGPLVGALCRIGLQRTRWPGLVERVGCDWGTTRRSYQPVVQELFLAARGGGLTLADTVPPLSQFDRYQLFSAAVDEHSLADLQAFTERGLRGQTWVILQFHGVGGGHRMDCSLSVFRDYTHWIADRYADSVVTIREGARRQWG